MVSKLLECQCDCEIWTECMKERVEGQKLHVCGDRCMTECVESDGHGDGGGGK